VLKVFDIGTYSERDEPNTQPPTLIL